MSLESEDILETTSERKKKMKKWVKFKLDETDYAQIERMFGKGNISKGMRAIVKEHLESVDMPKDPDERLILEIYREFIPSDKAETEISWDVAFPIAKKAANGDFEKANRMLDNLRKKNYIRNSKKGMRVGRKKLPDPMIEFLYGGV